jgi:hypothetical protein
MPLSENAIVSQLTTQKVVKLIQLVSGPYFLSVTKLTCYFDTDKLSFVYGYNPE